MKKFPTVTLFLMTIVLISIIGGVLAFYGTANGPWGYTDPVAYISTARSLANGQGLGYYEADGDFTRFTIQPPFYPIMLSVLGLFKINLVAGARWLNIFAFVASIFIAGWIFFRFSRVPVLGIIASALMCAFPYMVVMFSSAYSEPLFILLFLSGGLCLLAYLQHEKLSILLISALLVGMVPLTRYAGIAMVIAGCLTVLLFSSGKTWFRVKKAVLFVFVASLPILIWLVWVYFSTAHTIGDRSLGANWGELAAQFQTFRGIFMDTVWKWVPFQSHNTLLRYSVRFVLMGIGFIIILALSLLAERRLRKDSAESVHKSGMHIFAFFGLSSLTFIAVLIVTYLFTHPTIDIDNRMLLPFYVGIVMSLFGGLALWQSAWFKGRMRMLQIFPWLIAVVCVFWYFPQTRDEVEFYHSGDGLTAYHWTRSEIIQTVRLLPSDQPVISNDWELLLLWTGRPIYGFWNTFPTEPPMQATAYGTDPRDRMQSVFCAQGAALVIFNDFPSQSKNQVGESYSDQLLNLFAGLSVYGVYPDGTIYLCP
jgi:4-amino-4-deoxy-L-arabinose transferase-like glycosyltransferase